VQKIFDFEQGKGEILPESWTRFCSLIRALPKEPLPKNEPFLKLQEAALNKQAEAKRQGYEGNTSNMHATLQGNSGAPKGQDQSNQGCYDEEGYVPSKGCRTKRRKA
jgi:hypothetical protein